jgi:hypothetical protein
VREDGRERLEVACAADAHLEQGIEELLFRAYALYRQMDLTFESALRSSGSAGSGSSLPSPGVPAWKLPTATSPAMLASCHAWWIATVTSQDRPRSSKVMSGRRDSALVIGVRPAAFALILVGAALIPAPVLAGEALEESAAEPERPTRSPARAETRS